MKTKRIVFLSGLILLGLGSLALSEDKNKSGTVPKPQPETKRVESSVSQGRTAAPADYPVIGHLQKRERTITIKSGPKGTLYSVKTRDGKVLCENVSTEQLQAQAPELHEFIKTAVAGSSDARLRPKFDASVR